MGERHFFVTNMTLFLTLIVNPLGNIIRKVFFR